MATKVFIDGAAGTTGLEIHARLARREDIYLISLPEAQRKEAEARRAAFAQADVAILCLPDASAIEAVELAGETRIIDASTAHRVHPDWVYGMPELPGGRAAIAQAPRVANVGCYATGAIALLRPLRDAGAIAETASVVITGVSGYSGGGKALIAEYEPEQSAPDHFLYATGQNHKHIPEIMAHGRLACAPLFQPAVGAFAQGMVVQLHLPDGVLQGGWGLARLETMLRDFYAEARFVDVVPAPARVVPTALNGTNRMEISVHGNPDAGLITLTATLDNLGKGASGTAIQNLNLMIGAPEDRGLV